MEDANNTDLKSIIRGVIDEFTRTEQARAEPAYKTELLDERKRREELEQRLNELVQENQRSRNLAEQAERSAAIRNELQRLGVEGRSCLSRRQRRYSTSREWRAC